jgi:hypothetical protein
VLVAGEDMSERIEPAGAAKTRREE